MMNKSIMAVVIFASCATFRRAGHGFTDQGTAFAEDHFSPEQINAINAEPRLSVKQMPADAIPESVDRAPLDAALFAPLNASQEKAVDDKKPPAPKETKKPAVKASNSSKKPAGSGSGGDPANKPAGSGSGGDPATDKDQA